MAHFVLAFIAAFSFIYIPGTALLLAFGFSRIRSVVLAPIVSIVCYGGLGVLYSAMGIWFSWKSAVVPFVVISLVALFCRLVFEKRAKVKLNHSDSASSWLMLALYVVVGVVLGCYAFISLIDVDSAFMQAWDNGWHLSLVRSFLDSGSYSVLSTTAYPNSVSPLESAPSFYPAAWHILVAMSFDASGATMAAAANAVNALFSFVVFPSGMYYLLFTLFCDDKKKLFWGSLVSMTFASFPWLFLCFGPLFPNLVSLALVPAVSAVFISIFGRGISRTLRVKSIVLFFVGGVALALGQPNSVFSAAVFLIPFCVDAICRAVYPRFASKRKGAIFSIATSIVFVLLVCAVWIGLHNAPFMQAVVSFNWQSFASKSQAVVNALTQTYVSSQSSQILLGGFTLAGVAYSVYRRKYLWLSFSFMLVCVIYCASVTSDGYWKSLLAGFWYTDYQRIAATATFISTPLACLGLWGTATMMGRLARVVFHKTGDIAHSGIYKALAYIIVLAAVVFPSFEMPGYGSVETAFGSVRANIQRTYSLESNMLDYTEIEFLEKVKEAVPDGSLILNGSHDGSVFAYGLYDLDVFYRNFGIEWSGSERDESKQVRLNLDDYCYDQNVQSAINSIGAEYVLLLGQGNDEEYHLSSYLERDWAGVAGITDQTPGFELVLGDGDMRLYKINRESVN